LTSSHLAPQRAPQALSSAHVVVTSSALPKWGETPPPPPQAPLLDTDGAAAVATAREKSLAGQLDRMLEKEFQGEADVEAGSGAAFNASVANEQAVLETVARVTRQGARIDVIAPPGVNDTSEGAGEATDPTTTTARNDTSLSAGELERPQLSTLTQRLSAALHGSDARGAADEESAHDVARLIDSRDNRYVLSQPHSSQRMTLHSDAQLVSDLVTLLVAATAGAGVALALGQPAMVGHLAAGACVGPGGLDAVKELVQVETVASFGALLMLFGLGLEFSPSKLKAVRGVAIGGGAAAMLACMAAAGVAASMAGAPAGEGVFVGALVSMSSTAVVLRCLQERNALSSLSGQIMVGTLILQDCTVGFLFALLPALGGGADGGWQVAARAVARVAMRAAGFALLAAVASRLLVPGYLSWAQRRGSDTFTLAALSLAMAAAKASDAAGLSLELGAFVAGIMVSSTGTGCDAGEHVLLALAPVRSLLVALFLTSLGMLLNPPFLIMHAPALLLTCLIVVLAKTFITTMVVRAGGYSGHTALLVGTGLAQIGELAPLLLSRASDVGVIQRPAYLLLLGTTALSLLTTPLLFRLQQPLLRLSGLGRGAEVEEAVPCVEHGLNSPKTL